MAQQNTGLLLGRMLKNNGMSVAEVAARTGATRATVYNWLSGKGVSPAYRSAVAALITKFQARKLK